MPVKTNYRTLKEYQEAHRTNAPEVHEIIKAHILEYYTVEDLKTEVKNLIHPTGPTTEREALKKLCDGACFIFKHVDVNKFIDRLNLKSVIRSKNMDDLKKWELYKTLISQHGFYMINGGSYKGGK